MARSKNFLLYSLVAVSTICGSDLCLAQQSYRSYQQLSGKVLRSVGQQEAKRPPLSRNMPLRFQGWKNAKRFDPAYLKRFSRPRESVRHAALLSAAAKEAPHSLLAFASAQFAPSALPGLLLRDSLPAGYIPTAVATGDFNNDGNPDFVVANGGDNTLWFYFGKGDGTFNLPTILPITKGKTPIWITTADLRGVGRTDIIIAEPDSNSVGVFLGNGDGTFVESSIAVPDSLYTLTVGDFNHDGKLDIVVATSGANSSPYFVVLPGKGDGTFGQPILTPAIGAIFWVSTADLNGDGFPDLVETNAGVDFLAVQVFLNNGDGTFSQGQVIAQNYFFQNLGTLLFDGDEDGKLDAVVADTSGTLWFYHGNGDGTFSTDPGNFPIGDVPFGMAASDVNGDGHMDVVLAGTFVGDLEAYGVEAGDQICVLQGDGNGNFNPPTVYRGDSSSYALAVADFNRDGHPDVVTANQYNDSATPFLNDGFGGYGAPQGGYLGYEGFGPVNTPMSGAIPADVDGNGSTDLALIEWNQPPDNYFQVAVLLNDGKGKLSAPVHSDLVETNYGPVGDFVLADFRNTGHPDVLAIAENYTSYGYYISFAPNTGGGHFGPSTTTNLPNAVGVIGVGDFNHDGKLDFVTAGFCGSLGNVQCLQVFLGKGDGTFQTGYTQSFGGNLSGAPVAVYVGDFNRDGNLDLLVFVLDTAGAQNGDVYEFFGKGDATFQPGIHLFSSLGPFVVVDIDQDGHPDIVTVDFSGLANGLSQPVPFSIYLGQPDGAFKLSNTYAPYGYMGSLPQVPSGAGQYYAPMVADFNGDGKLDIAVFQFDGNLNRDSFVQFMLGNGDGTFTPTYGIFDFRKPEFDATAVDLTGTGRSDLFELNGYRSSYNTLSSVIAPAFQFALTDDPVPGNTGSAILLLDIPSTISTIFNLSTSDPAITVPPTITIPAGQISQIFNLTVDSAFNRTHVFSITASMGGGTSAVAYGSVAPSGTGGFLAGAGGDLAWPQINLAAGQTLQNLGAGARSINGYTSTLSFACRGLSQQGQCQFIPPNIALRSNDFSNARWVLSVNAGTPKGSYPASIRVTDGVLTQDIPFTLNVGDFSMSLNPSTIQIFPSGAASTTLNLTSVNKFDQIVNLSCSGLASGATCGVIPFNTPQPSGAQTTVGVQTQSMPTGNYQLTVTGVSAPVTHTVTAQLQVSDFTGLVSPTSATVKAGGSANFTVTVTPVNGFDGMVNFSCSSSTGLISCAFNPSSTSVPAGGNATSALTLTASSQLASGAEKKRNRLLVSFAIHWIVPVGVLVFTTGDRKRRTRLGLGLLLFIFGISCGGGSSSSGGGGGGGAEGGGGGGGGGSTSYSVTVQVSSQNGNYAKSAGTITLTVN